MWLRRLVACLAIAQLCAACANRVVSEQPWFSVASAAGDPVMRDGIWLADVPHCKVRETDPVERWPDCAAWLYRRGNQALNPPSTQTCEHHSCTRTYSDWSVAEALLVSGDPMVDQETGCDLAVEHSVPEDASAAQVPKQPTLDPEYCYSGVRPLARDAESRLTSVETWPILCGPWPDEGSKSNATSHPWPGVTVVGDNCTVSSEPALRDAAKRSYEVARQAGMLIRAHWVRDGYR